MELIKFWGMWPREKFVSVYIFLSHKGWILEGMIRESASAVNQKLRWNWILESRRDFFRNPTLINSYVHRQSAVSVFSNHKVFLAMAEKPLIAKSKAIVLVTQLQENELELISKNITCFNLTHRIIVQNKVVFEKLVEIGIKESLIHLFPGAIDRNLFCPSSDTEFSRDVYVLISGDFKERKNPEMIKKVIAQLPNIRFIVHGRNLEIFGNQFLASNKNVHMIPFNFLNQPKLMRNASAYLMISTLEGGPIPVLESLASGTPVVASDVGFCNEYINQNNGWLLSDPNDLMEIEKALYYSITLKSQVSKMDLLKGRFTWIELGNLFFKA